MISKTTRLITILLSIVVLSSVILLSYALIEQKKYDKTTGNLELLNFIGTYQTENHTGKIELTSDTSIDTTKNQKVTLIGHFNKEISEKETLLFRINNIKVTIYKNNEKIYSYAEKGTYPSFVKSPGNVWDIFVSPNIKPSDKIRIEMSSIYKNNLNVAYDNFIKQIYKGDSGILFRKMLKKSGFKFLVGGFFTLLGLVLLVLTLILKILKTPFTKAPLQLSLFTTISGLWIFIDFDLLSLVVPFNIFNNILDILCLSLIGSLLGLYLLDFIESKSRYAIIIMEYILIGFTLFYIVMQGFGIYDGYELITPISILIGIMACTSIGSLIYENIYNRSIKAKFICLSLCVCLIGIIDIVNYFLKILPYNIFFTIGFTLFIITQFLYMVYYAKKSISSVQKTRELENELAQSRIAIYLSQIKPHFLYNSLTAIKQLCAVDPKRAEQAVGDFANFLRANLDSLASTAPIAFDKELNNIKHYLSLEHLRFGKRLNIVYDIQVSDFMIPPLIIQPIVENAVRYGVTKKANGGTVTISTRENNKEIIIIVTDDGVGFDPMQEQKDNRTHLGIENVSNRIKVYCDGCLYIESLLGEGTTATIRFLKGGH